MDPILTARIDGLRRRLQLKTYKGTFRAAFASFTAHSHVDTNRGQIDLSVPRSSAFEVHTEVPRHAAFECDFARTVHSTGHESEFRSVVNGGGPELGVTFYRADIRLKAY